MSCETGDKAFEIEVDAKWQNHCRRGRDPSRNTSGTPGDLSYEGVEGDVDK